MKFFSYLTAMLLLLSVVACSDNDNHDSAVGSSDGAQIYLDGGTLSTTADEEGNVVMESSDGERVVEVKITYNNGTPASNAEVSYFYSEDNDINILFVKDTDNNYRDAVYVFNSESMTSGSAKRVSKYNFTVSMSDKAPGNYTFENDGFEIVSLFFQNDEQNNEWSDMSCMTIESLASHIKNLLESTDNIGGFAIAGDSDDDSASYLEADTDVAGAVENAIEAAMDAAGIAIDTGARYQIRYYTYGALASAVSNLDLSSLDKEGIILPYYIEADTNGVCANNNAPEISGTPDANAAVDKEYTFTPTASDADNDTLVFSITNKPDWATFSETTGELSGTPTSADSGTYSDILISVSDGLDTVSLAAFSINVAVGGGNAPEISGTPHTNSYVDIAYSFTPTASDTENDTLTFSIANKPDWADFNTLTGELSGTPAAADKGNTYEDIVISVTDGMSTANLAAFNIYTGLDVVLRTGLTNYTYDYYDGWYAAGVLRDYDAGDGIVTDNVTELMWDNNHSVMHGDEAEAYCANTVNTGGHTDWRLPTRRELLTIIDYSKSSPSLDSGLFSNIGSYNYWTSDKSVKDSTSYFYVHTSDGRVALDDGSESGSVICVRGDKLAGKTFVRDDTTETVTDVATGLMWQDNEAVADGSQVGDIAQAVSNCESLTLGGHDDWRLPNINELTSIVDVKSQTGIFAEFNYSYGSHQDYWSSTGINPTSSGMSVQFPDTNIRSINSNTQQLYRCVRGGEVPDIM